jgi:hypothetical protein
LLLPLLDLPGVLSFEVDEVSSADFLVSAKEKKLIFTFGKIRFF